MDWRLIKVIILLLLSDNLFAQKQDSYWVLGQHASLKFDIDFATNPKYESGNFDVISSANNASICDKQTGELLVYCHGNIIYNKNGVPMENGDSINHGKYSLNSYPAGLIAYEGVSILPFPNHDNFYYVFYTNLDSLVPGEYIPHQMYYSLVDITNNSGLGTVIQKDVVVLNKWLENGRINAIQHANGRDWWILVNGNNDSQHYIFLLDQTGIKLVNTQTIGIPFTAFDQRKNQTCVNQSGTQIAYTYGTEDLNHKQRIDFYDFDRCSGTLTNYKTLHFTDSLPIVGCSFSPNDSLLYVNNIFHLYQFNVKDKLDSIQTPIDTFDINVFDPFHVLFGSQKLAPDNKIYIGAWNGSRQIHAITKPNIRGVGCAFIKGFIRTDTLTQNFNNGLPNYPNFRLGVLKGSECHTIRETPPLPVTDELLIYPNPNNGNFKIVNGKSNISEVSIYNVLGQLIYTQNYSAALSAEINVNYLPKAMYIVMVENENKKTSKAKFVKQ